MIFETHNLSSDISPFIESIFHYKGFKPDHSIERVVPTGHVFILFELDGFTRKTFNNETLKENAVFSQVWVSGMHRNFLSISAHEDSEMLVIQFKPYGSYAFTHLENESINEKVLPLENHRLNILRDEILQAPTSEAKFKLVEAWLKESFDASKVPPTDLIEFVEKLQSQPVAKLKSLIESHPSSQKHLIAQFNKYVGLTPKYYQRILRFNDLLVKIQKKERLSWAEIAYECGFSDQAHFIREFKHFSGFNPTEFIEEDFEQERTNFFPLDR